MSKESMTFAGRYVCPAMGHSHTPYPVTGAGTLSVDKDGIGIEGLEVRSLDPKSCLLALFALSLLLLLPMLFVQLGGSIESFPGGAAESLIVICFFAVIFMLARQKKKARPGRPLSRQHLWKEIRRLQTDQMTLKPDKTSSSGWPRLKRSAGIVRTSSLVLQAAQADQSMISILIGGPLKRRELRFVPDDGHEAVMEFIAQKTGAEATG